MVDWYELIPTLPPKLILSRSRMDRRCVIERRQFTREFNLEAVRLIKQRGVSYAQASQDLGVHPTQLRNSVKQLADDPQHAFPGHGQTKPLTSPKVCRRARAR